jgi:hypothetical protein
MCISADLPLELLNKFSDFHETQQQDDAIGSHPNPTTYSKLSYAKRKRGWFRHNIKKGEYLNLETASCVHLSV